jgi:hypothetical protein
VLKRYSQDHNLKLRDVAEHLIATRQLPETSGVANNKQGQPTALIGSQPPATEPASAAAHPRHGLRHSSGTRPM